MSADPAPLLLSRGYRLDGEIGQGGMGVVYRATQLSLARSVAVKTLLAERSDPASSARFKREAQVLCTIEHPNVVRLLDVSLDTEPAFIVIEFIEGARALSEAWELLPQDLPGRLAIARALLEGLAAAHDLGIVHRDIKPGNVLLSATGEPKLIDFGLARALSADETRHTRDGQVMGTLAYMAPEQMQGFDVGLSADVYSFALMTCEILAARPIFSSAAGFTYVERLHKGVPDVRKWCPAVDPQLALSLGRALQEDPAVRPRTARELLAQWTGPASARDDARTAAIAPPVLAPPERKPRITARKAPTLAQAPLAQPASAPPAPAYRWLAVAVGCAVLLLSWRSVRNRPAAVSSIAAPSPAAPVVEIGGRGRNLVVSVTSSEPADLHVTWNARGEPRQLQLSAAQAHRVDVPMDGFSDGMSIRVAGRPVDPAAQLLPRLKRLADVLRPFDLAACLRRVRAFAYRREPPTAQVAASVIPDGIHKALEALGPALAVGLQSIGDLQLQRELLAKLHELEVVDAHLGQLGAPLATRVAEVLPAGWSERSDSPDDPNLPVKQVAATQKVSVPLDSLVDGVAPKGSWFCSGPGWEWLSIGTGWPCAPSKGQEGPRRSFPVEWTQPAPSNPKFRVMLLTVDSSSGNSHGVRVDVNDRLAATFSLLTTKSQRNANGSTSSRRLVPLTELSTGRNHIKVTVIPYPDVSQKNGIFVGWLSMIGYVNQPPPEVLR